MDNQNKPSQQSEQTLGQRGGSPLWKGLRLLLFSLDPETAHHLTVRVLLALFHLPIIGKPILSLVSGRCRFLEAKKPRSFGVEFLNPLGLAAGFDKNAELLPVLPYLGFGFAEIGTVTPRPQGGNIRPRLFRHPKEGWLFNRMGFNGLGASIVSQRLKEIREAQILPSDFRVGVNVGKNKDTPNEQAYLDYVNAINAFEGLADYFVINVSSPNTPGLRDLQTDGSLLKIVQEVRKLILGWKFRPPTLLKLSPELFQDENLSTQELFRPSFTQFIDGWVISNTLEGRFQGQKGGYSGKPLTDSSREALIKLRGLTNLPIISVGGILSAQEAGLRIELGASLIQIYSGWVLNGPRFPTQILKGLNFKKD